MIQMDMQQGCIDSKIQFVNEAHKQQNRCATYGHE